MALSDIICFPISWEQALDQTYSDEEYTRPKIPNTDKYYDRWNDGCGCGHCGFDLQATRGDYNLQSTSYGTVKHVSWGSLLGTRQFVIRHEDNSGVFYAHTYSRLANGTVVYPGDYVGRMGNSGTSKVHLHWEYLKTWNNWRTPANPGPRLRELKAQMGALSDKDLDKIRNIIEYRFGMLGEWQKAALLAQMNDSPDPIVNALLKQTSDAWGVVGKKFKDASQT